MTQKWFREILPRVMEIMENENPQRGGLSTSFVSQNSYNSLVFFVKYVYCHVYEWLMSYAFYIARMIRLLPLFYEMPEK